MFLRIDLLLFVLLAWILGLGALPASAAVSSYATAASDVVGQTGAAAVAIGVPDYRFVNDAGLGFGGTNADVFAVGESVVLSFDAPLRNIPGDDDLIVYAFVGGLGATDNARVQVEASSNGTDFTILSTFDTQDARTRPWDVFENDFEAVKRFYVDFGSTNAVTHIRLTNLAGTSQGLRLDAVEGLYPDVASSHAFEFRIQRIRDDSWQQFLLRIKNIADPGGVPIREIRIINSLDPLARLENTQLNIEGLNGEFICVENCIPVCTENCSEPPPRIPFSRYVWSVDGVVEAPAGQGLEPGRLAAHPPWLGVDTDSANEYLSGYSFEILFADGLMHPIDYDADVEKEIGSLYEKYLYFSSTPLLSWNRPTDFYEFLSGDPPMPAVPGLTGPLAGLLAALAGAAGFASIRSRARRDESA